MRGDWKLTPINQEKNSVVYSFFFKTYSTTFQPFAGKYLLSALF